MTLHVISNPTFDSRSTLLSSLLLSLEFVLFSSFQSTSAISCSPSFPITRAAFPSRHIKYSISCSPIPSIYPLPLLPVLPPHSISAFINSLPPCRATDLSLNLSFLFSLTLSLSLAFPLSPLLSILFPSLALFDPLSLIVTFSLYI